MAILQPSKIPKQAQNYFVKHLYLALTLGAIFTSFLIVFSSCRKINQATELGGGLIPPVDNINTFDTVITVEAYNDTFGLANDSLRLPPSNEHFLGLINSDPLFGKTDARLFLELKPSFYKYSFPRKDSVKIDSIVLVLDYAETYGDKTIPQTVNVYELDQIPSNKFNSDSVYLIRKNDFTYTSQLGFRNFLPSVLSDSIKAFQDTTLKQLRIRLDTSFARRLITYDSTNAYASDSAFKTYFKGFALQSIGSGNAVMGFNLGSANTKLAFYLNYPKTSGSGRDTTVTYFRFTSLSASANLIKRDYSVGQVATSLGGASPDAFVYMQNTPGTFATIKIPDLASLNNRLVHRAELIAEEVYDASDTIFIIPNYLYLDAYDPAISKFRTIPYDVSFDASGGVNSGSFGMAPVKGLDISGHTINIWKFNISRYVQHVFTRTEPLYELRLYSPFIALNQYRVPPSTTDIPHYFAANTGIVKGRVRLAGGTPGLQRMRLHIIYSKL